MRLLTEHIPEITAHLKQVTTVYTDLDNTLLGPKSCLFLAADNSYTLEPAAALISLLQKGVDVVITSGRNSSQLREIVRILGLNSYIAELGCQIYYEQGRECTTNYNFPVKDGQTLFEAIKESGAPQLLLERYQGFLEYHTPWSLQQRCTHLFRGLINVNEANAFLKENGFANLKLLDNGQSRTQGSLKPLPEIKVYHLLPKGTSKASAITVDQKKRGILPEQCLALGDSLTDLDMANAVSQFFLVANGVQNDPEIIEQLLAYKNAYLTTEKMGLGWAQVVKLLL